MKVEQLPSGTFRIRLMIDGHRYAFTDKDKLRVKQRIGLEDIYNFHSTRHYCVSSLHANGLPDAYIMERGGWPTPDVLIYVYRHTISDETAALTDRALNHFDSVTKFVTK